MATIAEKFRKIRIAPTFDLNRQNWIATVQYNGWVWNDSLGDWQITVSGVTYNGQDISRGEWYNKQDQWLVENPRTNDITYTKTGTYELRYDAERNAYYYFDTLGRRIYEDVSTQNASADLFIGKTISETPSYNFDEFIADILNNPLNPKTPEVGLYDTKTYFDLLTKTRDQYKRFWGATNKNEKIKALEERATDIVAEQGRIINLLAIAQKANTTDKAVINTLSLLTSLFGGTTGKAASVSVQTAVRYAKSQTTDKRIQLLGQELEYLETEYEAIKSYFDQNNANLKVTASSGFGNWLVKNWGWIVTAAVSISAMIYFLRKRNKSK